MFLNYRNAKYWLVNLMQSQIKSLPALAYTNYANTIDEEYFITLLTQRYKCTKMSFIEFSVRKSHKNTD